MIIKKIFSVLYKAELFLRIGNVDIIVLIDVIYFISYEIERDWIPTYTELFVIAYSKITVIFN